MNEEPVEHKVVTYYDIELGLLDILNLLHFGNSDSAYVIAKNLLYELISVQKIEDQQEEEESNQKRLEEYRKYFVRNNQ